MQELGYFNNSQISEATAINDAGQVTGFSHISRANSETHAFVWSSDTGLVDIGDLPGGLVGGRANDINASGVVVGDGQAVTGFRGFEWTAANGMTDLGDLPGGNDSSLAFAINAGGAVVGTSRFQAGSSAFLWTDAGGLQDLNSLVDDSAAGWHLDSAVGINDRGQIIGVGYDPLLHKLTAGFLLTPVPEPSSGALFALAAAVLTAAQISRRKRQRWAS